MKASTIATFLLFPSAALADEGDTLAGVMIPKGECSNCSYQHHSCFVYFLDWGEGFVHWGPYNHHMYHTPINENGQGLNAAVTHSGWSISCFRTSTVFVSHLVLLWYHS